MQLHAHLMDVYECSSVLQAVLVAALEENLYGVMHDGADDHIYPAAFVVLTSALGCYVVSKLQLSGQVGPAASWLTKCIYVAKLSTLLIPEVSIASLPCALFAPTGWRPQALCILG